MNATITSLGGRAPPGQNTRTPSRRISFARFSSRISRSSSFNRWRSSVVRPGRWPASRSAWRTHRRSVSVVQPSLAGDGRDRRPLGRMLWAVFVHHSDRAFSNLGGVSTWSCHRVHPLNEWALRQSRYGSFRRVSDLRGQASANATLHAADERQAGMVHSNAEWAYTRAHRTSVRRTEASAGWLTYHNRQQRPHASLDYRAPWSRLRFVNNLFDTNTWNAAIEATSYTTHLRSLERSRPSQTPRPQARRRRMQPWN